MSREISIGFRCKGSNSLTLIEVPAPYFLLGTQSTSKRFWSIPALREIGVTQLAKLGVRDPIYFIGWNMMADLRREITLLQEHLESIDFDAEIKAQWVSHLVYCYYLLVQTASRESVPEFTIG